MRGVVTCVHPRAAEEGAKVLEAGGNAFDAAVATAFMQMVVTPFSCGVGGMISAHIWAPAKGEHQVIDGCVRAGSLVTDDMWAKDHRGEAEFSGSSLFEDNRSTMGYTSICTPATVAGLAEVHRRYCTLPWADLLQPAIKTARLGYSVTPEMERQFNRQPEQIEPDTMTRIKATPECARTYLHADGSPLKEGEIIRNPDYANTLEQLAKRGADDFYQGELADAVAQDLEKNGAFITREDLRSYKTRSYTPRSSTYRNFEVFSNGPPGAGYLLHEALNVLEGLDLGRLEHGGIEYLSYMGATLQLVNQDRRDYLGDPEVIGEGPGNVLVSRNRAEQLRQAVLAGKVGGKTPPYEDHDTTHLTVVDEDGNVASITHSLGAFSGVITPGLGFIYNNAMNRFDPRPGHASSLAPGKARLHLMMPTIAFKDGNVAMALGAPGGNAILSALAQVFSNVVDFGMTAVEAISAPRIHAEGSTLWCESRTRTDTCDALRNRGFIVVQDPAAFSPRKALAQLVIVGANGELDGGSDPRGASGVVYARS